MTTGRLRVATTDVVLALVAALSLDAAASLLHSAQTTCHQAVPLLAPLAQHLGFLSPSASCRAGTFLLGPTAVWLVRALAVISVAGLLSGILGLLADCGAGVWLRRTVREARRWVRTRCRRHVPPRPVFVSVPLVVVAVRVRESWHADPARRRGPPFAC